MKTLLIELKRRYSSIKRSPAAGKVIAALGGLLYLWQTLVYIHTSKGMLDEGLYMVKGWYFATGQFAPFQDYGFLTNHMPLAFLIPGYVLKWFGPDLLTARLYAVCLGLLSLWAVWALAKRLGGNWWGAFAVWAIALNVAQVRIYSLALSQVLTATLVVLVALFAVRRQLNHWHVALAGILCGVLMMVRINMFPFAAAWLLYVFIQHRRWLWLSLAYFAIPILLMHLLYWPGILRMWAYWAPHSLFPFLQPYYTPWDKFAGYDLFSDLSWMLNLDDQRWNSIHAFWLAYRYNFVALSAVVLNLIFWPKRSNWPDDFTRYAAIFLNLAFGLLTLIHMWAALGGQSCHAFCFSGYITFFSSLGLVAFVATFPYRSTQIGRWRAWIAILIFIVACAGLGLSTANLLGQWVANLPVPTPSGSFPLWAPLYNKWGLGELHARTILPAFAGALVSGVVLLLVWASLRFNKAAFPGKVAQVAWLALFVTGFILSPTALFSLGDRTLHCGGDTIQAYEDLATELRQYIQPGDKLFYDGPNSPAILLYLPGVQLYPQQMNNTFAFNDDYPDDDPDELLRFGYWNQVIKDRWLEETDWVLIEERRYSEWVAAVDALNLDTVFISQPLEECTGQGSRQVLLRNVKE